MTAMQCPCCGARFELVEGSDEDPEGSENHRIDLESVVSEIEEQQSDRPQSIEEMQSHNDPAAW